MNDKRAPRRSLDDWMELVTECRQSGLTDAAWCEAQGISPSCFYNAVSRLRKRASSFVCCRMQRTILYTKYRKFLFSPKACFKFINPRIE